MGLYRRALPDYFLESLVPKFDVDFYIRHYNGSITIDAPSAREAKIIAENLDISKLEGHTSSVEVYVEQVQGLDEKGQQKCWDMGE